MPAPLNSAHLMAVSAQGDSFLIGKSDGLFEWRLGTQELEQIPLTPEARYHSATWHPLQRRIAYTDRDRVVIFEPGSNGPPSFFSLRGYAGTPQWDPAGTRLRVSVLNTAADTTTWWELDATGRAFRELSRFSSSPKEVTGTWTHDGRFFILEARTSETSDLWVADGRSGQRGQVRQLTNDSRLWGWPATARSTHTIFAVGMEAKGRLESLTGGKPPLPGVSGAELEYSRDGRWVAYSRFPDHTIWRAKCDGTGQQISPRGLEAHQPHWDPDSRRIAFMGGKRTDRDVEWRIYIVPSAGGTLDIPLPDGGDQGVPSWSPDGQSLYFGQRLASSGFQRAAIKRLDLVSKSVTTIPAPVGMWSPRMSPDGKYLAAVSHDQTTLYIRDNYAAPGHRALP